ncbi:damage-control phosphatase ARMT1 family protein [Streptomyces sp. 8L]|uniref:damage-control phosphatase ARMT1 family protein n=1 Tax=Streptomyces sp. 8L TaxID=2877242 RepID=UPI001CD5FF78|nr:damage-control phosphatase ARMT1 family protein [Streptomyces sp. 8L]MCA1218985.1 protein-glutamate O-methyltransferase family protein [Streptomyces sp. 8L]
MDTADAPEIRTDVPGTFAHGVLAERHPALIARVREATPYPPAEQRALDALLTEITRGTIAPLPREAHDAERWVAWGGDAYYGGTWFDPPFLWAESYFYRRLLGAVGYFTPGPRLGLDPFAPFKDAELRGGTVDEELAALDALEARPEVERADALLGAALWGNRADLGFRITAEEAEPGGADRLVADDRDRLWGLLPPGGGPDVRVHLIADNAGRELVPDLLLLDHLLRTGRAGHVVLHVKPYPYYVSDATTSDATAALRRLGAAPGQAGEAGRRLWTAVADGRLGIGAHPFFCAPFAYDAMPDDLRAELGSATVTIVKGDLNYRRLVGDRLWPPTTPFASRVAHFPGPVAALRTLKSDVITGLAPATATALDASGEPWRVSGTQALVQVAGAGA